MDTPRRQASALSRREALKITAAFGAAGLLAGPVALEMIRQTRLHHIRRTRSGLGTLITVTVADTDANRGEATVASAFAEVSRLEGILSRHRPESPVSVLNRTGQLARPPNELVAVLQEAERIASLAGGAFDVTVAPLLALYESRFAAGMAPTDAEIAAASSMVGHNGLNVSHDDIFLDRPGMSVTLDGIAKGYIVDRVVDHLARAGCTRVVVDAGGDIGSHGLAESEWRVAVQDPNNIQAAISVAEMKVGMAIATSGDYMQPYTPDRRAHPIIDPRTGRSPQLAASASVATASALTADALSTAALVLGPVAGKDLIASLDGAEGLIVSKDGAQHLTRGWSSGRKT